VNSLGVPLQALKAWDSELITGEVRYLVLLLNFQRYPITLQGSRSDVSFRVGISPHYKPTKSAIGRAFKLHSSVDAYTGAFVPSLQTTLACTYICHSAPPAQDFDAISLSKPLDSLFMEKFPEILMIRAKNPKLGWAAAEHHVLKDIKSPIDMVASAAADKDEKESSISNNVRISFAPSVFAIYLNLDLGSTQQ
jgi:ubiquitin-conjugating enzyme E2 Q